MSPITTHVLDTGRGLPAQGVAVRLDYKEGKRWAPLAEDVTDADGRARELLDEGAALKFGVYRLTFGTAAYFKKQRVKAFFPVVEITFEISEKRHYHVPLLLSPFGYSTYRGS
jgi:5-hydroxyisourate hydrolase